VIQVWERCENSANDHTMARVSLAVPLTRM